MTDYLNHLLSDLDARTKVSKWMPPNFKRRCKAIARAVRSGDLITAKYWLISLWGPDTKTLLWDLLQAIDRRLSPKQQALFTALQREPCLPLKPGKMADQILTSKIRKLQAQS
jgi:hypothetical protein